MSKADLQNVDLKDVLLVLDPHCCLVGQRILVPSYFFGYFFWVVDSSMMWFWDLSF